MQIPIFTAGQRIRCIDRLAMECLAESVEFTERGLWGLEVRKVIPAAIAKATLQGGDFRFEFNGVRVTAHPGSHYADLIHIVNLELEIRALKDAAVRLEKEILEKIPIV